MLVLVSSTGSWLASTDVPQQLFGPSDKTVAAHYHDADSTFVAAIATYVDESHVKFDSLSKYFAARLYGIR